MRVNKIFVDSYGERSNETLDFSQGNFRLIYGRNEAGKSTLLNFIRDLLFGLPNGNDRSALFGEEIVGGAIEFQLQDGRVGKVSQKWSRFGKKTDDEFYAAIRNLQTGVDDVLERDAFLALMGGADRDLFARYFGFSYQELVDVKSTFDRSSLDRLVYGMILGGAERLEAVKTATAKRCDELFLPRGKKKINEALRRLQDAKKALRSSDTGTSAYRKAREDRDEAATRVGELKAQCDEAREKLRRWQTLDDARDVFEQFSARQNSCDALIAQTLFDEETLARFDESQENNYTRLKALRDAVDGELPGLESETKAEDEELQQLEASRSIIVEYNAQISTLSKNVEVIRKTRGELPELERKLKSDKNALLDELQALGFLASESTDEVIDETIKVRRTPIRESAFHEIDDLTTKEGRIEAKFDDLNNKISTERGNLEQRKQAEELARQELVDQFGEETHEDDAREFEEINESFSGLKKDVKDLIQKESSLNEERRSNDAKLRSLIVQVCGSDVDDATFQRVAQTLGGKNVAAPLDSEFKEIEDENAALQAKITDLQKESERLDKELADLESEIQQTPQDVVSLEILNERRDARKKLWFAFKNDLLIGKNFERAELETNVDELEGLTREVDNLADQRFKHAELSGQLEERRRKYNGENAQKTKVDADLKKRTDARKALQNRAGALWSRVGLECCAALSIEAGREWLDDWKSWRDERTKITLEDEELKNQKGAVASNLQKTFEVASRWVESEPFETESLEQATLFVEKTLKSAKSRLEEYRGLVGKVDGQRTERIATEQKIAGYERELTQAVKDRDELTSRLDQFCRRYNFQYDEGVKNPCTLLKETLQKLCKWQKKFDAWDEQSGNIQAEKSRIRQFEESVDELKNKLQETLVCESAEDYVKNWDRRLTEALDVENNWKNAQKSYGEKSGKLKTKRETKESFDKKLAETAEKLGVAIEKFTSFREDARAYRELRNLLAQDSRTLREKLGARNDDEFERLLTDLTEIDAETVKENCRRYKSEVDGLDEEREKCSAKKGELDGRLKMLENDGNPALLNSRYQEALSALREAINVYVPTLFARRALEDSLRICKEEKIPEILEYAGDVFQNVTVGRYGTIQETEPTGKSGRSSKAEKERLDFQIFERNGGTSKTTGQLSSGTREQLYLSLRLAHIRQYCQQAEPLPIWADDVLLSASCERVKRLIASLKNFADEGYQIVLSTCQTSTLHAFKEIVGEEFVTKLKPGKIRR